MARMKLSMSFLPVVCLIRIREDTSMRLPLDGAHCSGAMAK
jgi:hypothetical protein